METYGQGYGLSKFMFALAPEPCKKERHSMLLENSSSVARQHSTKVEASFFPSPAVRWEVFVPII
jgi:hypothetical protein